MGCSLTFFGNYLGDTATTPTKPPTTTVPRTPEQQVEQAYRSITESYYRRLQNPDPRDPATTRRAQS